jgi:hypothetical protein
MGKDSEPDRPANLFLGSLSRGRGVRSHLLRAAVVVVSLVLVAPAFAAEPPAAEVLPAPHPAGAFPPPGPYPMFMFPRVSRYEVWDYYGVDRFGHWRPRVIYSSTRSFYLYNGAPAPAAVHPTEFMPYATD